MLSRLARHTSNYSAGSLLVTMASVITFPIFTRIFSVAEYGTLGLVTSTVLLLVGIGKFGIQHATIRFYAEVDAGKRSIDTIDFFSTVLLSMAGIGALATVLCAIGAVVLPSSWWGQTSAGEVLLVASPLIFVRVVDSGLLNLLRAQQRSAFYSIFTAVRKYLGLGVILSVLFFIARSLEGFFVSTIVAEGLSVCVLFLVFMRKGLIDVRRFSWPLLTAMLSFGLPLLGSELSSIVLNIGGRYIINADMGAEPLGAYSAAYNLCDYVQAVLTASFGQALIPMYTNLWEGRGREITTEFLQQSLRYYIAISLAVLAGMMAIGPELLRLLASDKYDAGSALIPYVIAGMLISGGTPIFSAGIYIKKQTKVVMYSVMAAAIANLALTIALTPVFGIVGAGVATLLSYVLYSSSTAYFGRHTINIRMPWPDLVKFCALSAIMYWAVTQFRLHNLALKLPIQIVAGVVIYGLLLLLSDRPIRDMGRGVVGRLLEMRRHRH
ncbi:MAG: oligosaccharide flippase family protein [Gammaproteobacteria bacterium]|nr:oligosaccharide flippase family protein [Gammaproteobacteria bacterium]